MISAIFETIRARKKNLVLGREEQYYKLIRELAQGSEVDCEHAAEVLDGLQKDEAILEKDVELQRKRIELARKLERKRVLTKEFPKLQAALEAANTKFEAELAKLRSMVDEKIIPFQEAQTELSQLTNVEQELIQSCTNPIILARKNENLIRRQELMAERQPISDDLQETKKHFGYHQSQLSEVIRQIESDTSREIRSRLNDRRDQLEQTLAKYQASYDNLSEPLKRIDDEMAKLNKEIEKLNQEALVP